MTEKETILAGLDPMFKEANEKGLYFYCSYQDMWFSPEELTQAQSEGRFLWGACNWRLRSPQEHIDELKRRSRGVNQELYDFESKLN